MRGITSLFTTATNSTSSILLLLLLFPTFQGRGLATSTPLTVSPISDFVTRPLNVTVLEGHPAVLECKLKDPVHNCQWLFFELGLDVFDAASKLTLVKQFRPASNNDCSIKFTSARKIQTGQWICKGLQIHAQKYVVSEPAILQVISPKGRDNSNVDPEGESNGKKEGTQNIGARMGGTQANSSTACKKPSSLQAGLNQLDVHVRSILECHKRAWLSSCEGRKREGERADADDVSTIKAAMTEMKRGLDEKREARKRERETEGEAREREREAKERDIIAVKRTLEENEKLVRELNNNVNKILKNEQLREFSDCSDLLASGESRTGVYKIYPSSGLAARVFCDMETDGGGWTVFLARMNQSEQLNFNRGWEDYKEGFWSPEDEYWLGNDNLYRLTSARNYVIRLEAKDYEGAQTWGEWNLFKVDSENEMYRLKVGDYNAQSIAHPDLLSYNTRRSFSAKDLDNDSNAGNCAKDHNGGFWFGHCSYIYPTGVYGLKKSFGGIRVMRWANNDSSEHYVQSLHLKIRPVK